MLIDWNERWNDRGMSAATPLTIESDDEVKIAEDEDAVTVIVRAEHEIKEEKNGESERTRRRGFSLDQGGSGSNGSRVGPGSSKTQPICLD